MKETEIFEILRQRINSIQLTKKTPIRIAVNGIEGAGKTVFSEHFVRFLNSNNFDAKHVSIDGFHYNRQHRYRQGKNSAIGYYQDSYNETAFVEKVLIPSQLQKPYYISAIHSLETDEYIQLEPTYINNDTILVTDGAYLFKPIYVNNWDLKIYLKTSFDIALTRGSERDQLKLEGLKNAKELFMQRYHQSSRMYIEEVNPESIADVIIDVSDFNNLTFIKL